MVWMTGPEKDKTTAALKHCLCKHIDEDVTQTYSKKDTLCLHKTCYTSILLKFQSQHLAVKMIIGFI